jgi:hypothetical protein
MGCKSQEWISRIARCPCAADDTAVDHQPLELLAGVLAALIGVVQ